jgi:hypothetical protein
MAQLDNDAIGLGDTVYDVVFGVGRVVEIFADGRFLVGFTSRRVVYSSTGHSKMNRGRTLYWHDPIVAIPTKSDSRWLLMKRLCAAIIAEVRVP